MWFLSHFDFALLSSSTRSHTHSLYIQIPIVVNTNSNEIIPDVTFDVGKNWPSISMLQTTALNTALLIFNVLRPLHDVGFTLFWDMNDLYRLVGGVQFLFFSSYFK